MRQLPARLKKTDINILLLLAEYRQRIADCREFDISGGMVSLSGFVSAFLNGDNGSRKSIVAWTT